ncbi:MAG: ABC transporter substrate-binding protein [Nitrosomonas sp.]
MKAKQIINMRSIIKYQLALLLLIAGLFVNTSMAGSGSPEEVVVKMQSSLIQVMKDGEKLGYNGRFKFLEPVIDQSHDMELIIKTILGATYWSQLDNSQKKLIINTFRELSVSTYASRFTQYEGEQFEVVEQRDLPHEQKLVRSQLTKSDGGTVNFDYVLHKTEAGWRIVNILFDGVSDLAIKRGEYRAVMQRDGFPALIELLKEKITAARQP